MCIRDSAMALQIAKSIGELATVVNGDVDAIIITGGIAYSCLLYTSYILVWMALSLEDFHLVQQYK